MSDLFGSFWDIDKDIIFPNDKIKLELTIDNKWLVSKTYSSNVCTNPTFVIDQCDLNIFYQNDSNVNTELLKSIASSNINIPYEYIYSIDQNGKTFDYAGYISITNDLNVADVGNILKKIYICPESVPAVGSKYTQLGLFFENNMQKVEFKYGSVDHGTYDIKLYDNLKNSRIKHWNAFAQEANCFLPVYFYDPKEKDDSLSGTQNNASSFGVRILKKSNDGIDNGDVKYVFHVISVKFLNITPNGALVNNSELKANQTPPLPINNF